MLKIPGAGWENVAARLKVVSLTPLVQLLIPSLILSTFPRSTRGVSFYAGVLGFVLGGVLVSGSVAVGWLLSGPFRIVGATVTFWLLGTSGLVMMVSSITPIAFVKPICTRCRLLPIIKEHEAIHLSGVPSEKSVWDSMKTRHSK